MFHYVLQESLQLLTVVLTTASAALFRPRLMDCRELLWRLAGLVDPERVGQAHIFPPTAWLLLGDQPKLVSLGIIDCISGLIYIINCEFAEG
jgi:hypothetical protein